MDKCDKLSTPAAVCRGKNNVTSLVGGGEGVNESPRTGLKVFREEKKYLHLPGLKPGIAEPIIPVSMSTTLSWLR
jgi:hypothetical protein